MTRLAPSAAPPTSLRIWADATRIFAELPTKPGLGPCIMSFPRSGDGLSKVLALIYGQTESAGSPQSSYSPPKHLVGTPLQHATAESILRKRGIVK